MVQNIPQCLCSCHKLRDHFVVYFPDQVLCNNIKGKSEKVISSLFIYSTDAQLNCTKRMSKFTLNFHLNAPTCFGFNNHHQGTTINALIKL